MPRAFMQVTIWLDADETELPAIVEAVASAIDQPSLAVLDGVTDVDIDTIDDVRRQTEEEEGDDT